MDSVKIIQDKCAQYWNAPQLNPEEMHVVLEFIHRHASDVEQRIEELEKELICTQEINECHNIHIDELEDKYTDALEACRAGLKYQNYKVAVDNSVIGSSLDKLHLFRIDFQAKANAVVEKEDDGDDT